MSIISKGRCKEKKEKQTLLPINIVSLLEITYKLYSMAKRSSRNKIPFFTKNVEIPRCYILQSNNIMMQYELPSHNNVMYNEIGIKSLLIVSFSHGKPTW